MPQMKPIYWMIFLLISPMMIITNSLFSSFMFKKSFMNTNKLKKDTHKFIFTI